MKADLRPTTDEGFRLLVESVLDYGIFMLAPDGRVVSWNAGAKEIIGYSASEIIGQHFSCFYPPEDIASKRPHHHLQQARTEKQLRDQGWRLRKDGSRFWASAIITRIRNQRGKLIGFTQVVREVASGKMVENRLHANNEQLRLLAEKVKQCRGNTRLSSQISKDIRQETRLRRIQAEKKAAEKANKSKDNFLAVLSHELRTPLTPALAAASYLADHADLSQDCQEEVAVIRRNIQLEARLIDDLLDFTRLIRGKIELHFEVVDAHRVLREIIEVVNDDIIEKELDIKMPLGAKEHHIWADPVRIRQVFWNLIRNAAKFTPVRGEIAIRTLNNEQGHFQLEVSDTGVGIEPEKLGQIFNAFEQESAATTREFGGLGLGLAISKRLVDLHLGRIAIESAGKNCGALSRVIMDALHEKEMINDEPSVEVSAPRSLRLLVVEDHDDTRRTLVRLLSRCGHKVSSTDHVESALRLLESKRFDAVVSDIGLPDRSGYELIELAKKRHSIKGIALSGFGMEEDIRRSFAAGFDHHLTKPVDFRNLRNLLSEMAI